MIIINKKQNHQSDLFICLNIEVELKTEVKSLFWLYTTQQTYLYCLISPLWASPSPFSPYLILIFWILALKENYGLLSILVAGVGEVGVT